MTDADPTDDPTTPDPDEVLAGFLASGLSAAKAGKKVGISERTVRRRLQDEGFRRQVDRLRAGIVSTAVGQLSASMAAAAGKLARLMRSKDERISLAAAKEIIGAGLRARQLEDMERQVAELVARVDALTDGGPR